MRARVGVLEDVRGATGGGLCFENAMSLLGSGLLYANHQEDALSVQEAELSMMRRVGDSQGIFSPRTTILRSRMHVLDGMNRHRGCNERCTLDV